MRPSFHHALLSGRPRSRALMRYEIDRVIRSRISWNMTFSCGAASPVRGKSFCMAGESIAADSTRRASQFASEMNFHSIIQHREAMSFYSISLQSRIRAYARKGNHIVRRDNPKTKRSVHSHAEFSPGPRGKTSRASSSNNSRCGARLGRLLVHLDDCLVDDSVDVRVLIVRLWT